MIRLDLQLVLRPSDCSFVDPDLADLIPDSVFSDFVEILTATVFCGKLKIPLIFKSIAASETQKLDGAGINGEIVCTPFTTSKYVSVRHMKYERCEFGEPNETCALHDVKFNWNYGQKNVAYFPKANQPYSRSHYILTGQREFEMKMVPLRVYLSYY